MVLRLDGVRRPVEAAAGEGGGRGLGGRWRPVGAGASGRPRLAAEEEGGKGGFLGGR